MIGAALDYAQAVAEAAKVRAYGPDNGIFGGREVYRYRSPHRAGGLIHKTAGLSEEYVLGILPYTSDLDRREAELSEVIYHGPYKDLERRGGAETAAGEDVRRNICVKAADAKAPHGKARRNAPDQRGGRSPLRRNGRKLAEVYFKIVIALGLYADNAAVVRKHRSPAQQFDRCRKYFAVLVVGVVAADLGPSRSGVESFRRPAGIKALKLFFYAVHYLSILTRRTPISLVTHRP